jgi:hypothetical protein
MDIWCFILLLVVLGGIIFVVIQSGNARAAIERARQAAHNDYQTALTKLKANPTNPDLKQQALQYGRVYAN